MPRELAPGARLLVAAAFLIVAVQSVAQSASSPRWVSRIEPNRGQAAAWAEYVFHSRSYDALIRGGSILIRSKATTSHQPADLQLEFRDSQRSLSSKPLETLAGRTNYLLGADPRKWVVDLPRYSRVEYFQLYPSIELLYDATREELEYELRLLPGADPDHIRLEIEGNYKIHVDDRGALVLTRGDAHFALARPEAYQRGKKGLRRVDVAYELRADNEVRFRLGPYDRSAELTIDPYVLYATYLGGFDPLVAFNEPNGEGATDIASDVAGNAYVVGDAFPAFPVTPNSYQTTTDRNTAFVAKIDPQGKSLVYSTFISGLSFPRVAVDRDGNVYCVGSASDLLPVTPGSYQHAVHSVGLIKLNQRGQRAAVRNVSGGQWERCGDGRRGRLLWQSLDCRNDNVQRLPRRWRFASQPCGWNRWFRQQTQCVWLRPGVLYVPRWNR
jgi:hypothetical protein